MMKTLAIRNYRSIRDMTLGLDSLTVVTGPNGSGKTSLYRALRLLADIAKGNAVNAFSLEGGLQSVMWAGAESKKPSTEPQNRVRLGFSTADIGYSIDLGYPTPANSAFDFDPDIKAEWIWTGELPHPSAAVLDRNEQVVHLCTPRGEWVEGGRIASFDSVLTHVADPLGAPDAARVREYIRSWRFYDRFQVDTSSPIRAPHLAVRTPVLSHDGTDIACALQTIMEIGDHDGLNQAIEHCFPGASLQIRPRDGYLSIYMQQPGLRRPLSIRELSEGTISYLLWAAALFTPRPPPLMVLNEPETCLHSDLLLPLAQLIANAATRSQLWVISHSPPLVDALTAFSKPIRLEKCDGETVVAGQNRLGSPPWRWLKH